MLESGHTEVPEFPDCCDIPYFDILRDSLDLAQVPFTERGSRILVGSSKSTSSAANIGIVGCGDETVLDVRMAERWTHLEGRLGNHRSRPPLIQGLRPTNASGHPLPFELTTWPHRLQLRTPVGGFEVFFADRETIYVRTPGADCGLSFSIMAEHFEADDRGGIFDYPRLLAVSSDDHSNRLKVTGSSDGKVFLFWSNGSGMPGTLAINIPESGGCSREVRDPRDVRYESELAWRRWFDAAPRVGERYWRQYYFAWMILRTGLLSPVGHLKREALAPSKTHYLGIWHWDAYFHALAYRHVDAKLAQDQLLALLDYQLDNGMIPDVVHDEGLIVREDGPDGRDLTKPPLIAWSALKLYESGAGSAFLRSIYEPLVRWNNWWLHYCDEDGDGIAQYNHPFSSGLDDSPLWDSGTPVESPDLSTYLCVHMQALGAIARIVGRYRDAENWDSRAKEMALRAISHFYDARPGVFWATRDHQPVKVLTPFNLLPIWTGQLPARQVRSAVGLLTSPSTFWTRYGVPTVSVSDRCFEPERMWRGPTWINVNYMLIEALSQAGYRTLASTLTDRTIDLVQHGGAAEYYNPMTGAVPAKAAPAFGWSAALFIDLVIRRTRGHHLSFGG